MRDGQTPRMTPDSGPRSPRALLVDDTRFEHHVPLGHHPERPERLAAARDGIAKTAIAYDRVPARAATHEELARVHEKTFLAELNALRGQRGYIDPDTYVSPESVDIAILAAGSLVAMIDAVIDGPTPKGVALLRPPGHHACPDRAMGFCLINNVAVGAAHARARGVERVAIVDWDVHHGNGTQETFWRDPSVLYVSMHQSPFYPGTGNGDETGAGPGEGFTVNVPLAAGSGDATYVTVFDRIIVPVLEAFRPEIVLVSAGFDASARDPLAQMQVSADAFGWMAWRLAMVANATAAGRMVLALEGGYDLVALESGLRRSLEGAVLEKAPALEGDESDEWIESAARIARRFWPTVA